jgi:pimeloyl-ACP methyl ester carboxylesterase
MRRWGTPGVTTLVLLHEGLGCVELWRDFPERLAAETGMAVFAWSRPGYGRSAPCPLPRPLDYLRRAAAEDVGPVLDAAGIGRCVLIGHSDGASIAAVYAAAGDPRVAATVLMSPHYFVEPMCIAAIRDALEAYVSGNLRERMAKYHDHADVAFHGWNGAWLDPGFAALDLRAEARAIAVPVLQIQGSEDPYGTMAQPATLAMDTVTTLALAAKHAPHLEAAEATMAAIVDFIGGLPR